jgi:hypothetical protein
LTIIPVTSVDEVLQHALAQPLKSIVWVEEEITPANVAPANPAAVTPITH